MDRLETLPPQARQEILTGQRCPYCFGDWIELTDSCWIRDDLGVCSSCYEKYENELLEEEE